MVVQRAGRGQLRQTRLRRSAAWRHLPSAGPCRACASLSSSLELRRRGQGLRGERAQARLADVAGASGRRDAELVLQLHVSELDGGVQPRWPRRPFIGASKAVGRRPIFSGMVGRQQQVDGTVRRDSWRPYSSGTVRRWGRRPIFSGEEDFCRQECQARQRYSGHAELASVRRV
jgi:hypothetical protein